MKELFPQEVDTEDRKGTKEDRGEFESGQGVSEKRDEQCLDIYEESFATEVGRVKELKIARFESVEGVDAIGGFVRIESDRNLFDTGEADDKSEQDDEEESERGKTSESLP